MRLEISSGLWLKRRRRLLDLTQEGLAELVGCSAVTIRKLESDERRPSKQLAEHLAHALAIPPTEQDRFLHYACAATNPRETPRRGRTKPAALRPTQRLVIHRVAAIEPGRQG